MVKLCHRYEASIIRIPYTLGLVANIIKQERKCKPQVNNSLQILNSGEKIQLSPDITLELVSTIYSIHQTVNAALYTSEDIIVYTNN